MTDSIADPGLGTAGPLADHALPDHGAPPRRKGRLQRVVDIAALVALLLIVLAAVIGPELMSQDPEIGQLGDALQPPAWADGGSAEHVLGTDHLGRDVLTRLLYGARISLVVSVVAIVVGGIVGATVGALAGFRGGIVEALLMRLVDVSLSIPVVLIALIVAALDGPSFRNVIIVLALSGWSQYARQVRAESLVVRQRDFVLQATSFGVPGRRVLRRHVLPNVRDSIIVMASLQMATAVLLESSLSFLGVGIPPPTPAWGVMVSDGASRLRDAWWVSFFPGVAIAVLVISINIAGDWLREHIDPSLGDA